MYTIFIATDFSKAAKNATRYGISMAKVMQADIVLFHVCNSHAESKKIVNVLNAECDKIKEESMLNCKVVISSRYTAEEIIKEATKTKSDIIIMGITEAPRMEKDILGSMTRKLIKVSKIPVMAIPEKAEFSSISKLVLAVGTAMPELNLLNKLAKLAGRLDTQLQIVHIHTDNDKDVLSVTEAKELVDRAAYNNISFINLKGNNIAKELDNYIERERASMLIIIRRNTSLLHELSGGFAGRMTFISNAPLLIVNEEEYSLGSLGISEEEILG